LEVTIFAVSVASAQSLSVLHAFSNLVLGTDLYDAVTDFNAVVRDPATLTNLRAAYNSGYQLHLNPLGCQTIANAIDLTLLT